MTIPSLGRGGLPVYSPTSSTATATNGSRVVSFTGTALVTTDPTTNALTYAAGVGDIFVVQGVSAKIIESVDTATQITLCDPWTAATQTAVTNYYIVRNSVPAYGFTAKAIQDVLAIGSDTSPDTSRTIDDGTARVKLRLSGSQAQLAVGATGAADGALLAAIQVDPTTGIVQFPKGFIAPVVGFRNRFINGGFDFWQRGLSLAWTAGLFTYAADRWLVSSSQVATVARVTAPAGFRGQYALNIAGTGYTVGQSVSIQQRAESQALIDFDGQDISLSFDLNATTTAGSLTGSATLSANTALDNGTYSSLLNTLAFTVPVGSGKVTIKFPAANTVGIKNGATLQIGLTQAGSTGNINASFGACQIERGAAVNAFEPRPLAIEVELCQRFYQTGGARFEGYVNTGWNGGSYISFATAMRASPTITQTSTQNGGSISATPGNGNISASGFMSVRAATGTGPANYQETWTANAEL